MRHATMPGMVPTAISLAWSRTTAGSRVCGMRMLARCGCRLLFLLLWGLFLLYWGFFFLHWDRRCGRRYRGRNQRRGGGGGNELRDGGVMPMAVLDGPHFARRRLARRLRRGRELPWGRHGRHGHDV